MRWAGALAAALAAGAIVAAPSDAGRSESPAGRSESPAFSQLKLQVYAPAKDAPPFALPDLDGQTRRLADYRGKALLLFFWATW
jgi:cytochrome oxidase Cu insertion factor (SCO1/SenC/PrrC family)